MTNPSVEREKEDERSALLQQFEETHREEIEAITRVLVKITSLRPEEIAPHVHTMLSQLVKPKERPFSREQLEADLQTLSEAEVILPDEAFMRESIYADHD